MMQKLVRHQYKDQIWYEVEDAPRITRYREDPKDNRKDPSGNALQADSLPREGIRTSSGLRKGELSPEYNGIVVERKGDKAHE